MLDEAAVAHEPVGEFGIVEMKGLSLIVAGIVLFQYGDDTVGRLVRGAAVPIYQAEQRCSPTYGKSGRVHHCEFPHRRYIASERGGIDGCRSSMESAGVGK